MKVLHVITSLNTGGAEKSLLKFLKGSDKTKYQHVVVTLMEPGDLKIEYEKNVEDIISLEIKQGHISIKAFYQFLYILKVGNFDVINAWMYHACLLASLIKILSFGNQRLYWNVRQCIYDTKYESFLTRLVIYSLRFLSKIPDQIIYNSTLAKLQHEALGFADKKGTVVFNGTRPLKPQDKAIKQIHSQYSIHKGKKVIGTVGRFNHLKDYDNFILAAEHVMKVEPDCYFIMVGKGLDWNNIQLKQKLESRKLLKSFLLCGQQTDVENWMSIFDLYVCSSKSEGFSNTVLEAMSLGLPCVVTDVGENANIVGNLNCVVPARDPTLLSEGILSILKTKPKEKEKLRIENSKRIKDKFSEGKFVSAMDKIIGAK